MAQDWCLSYGVCGAAEAEELYKRVCKRKGVQPSAHAPSLSNSPVKKVHAGSQVTRFVGPTVGGASLSKNSPMKKGTRRQSNYSICWTDSRGPPVNNRHEGEGCASALIGSGISRDYALQCETVVWFGDMYRNDFMRCQTVLFGNSTERCHALVKG